jgi:PAT family beta-lactamase induction signal transducer AmpG
MAAGGAFDAPRQPGSANMRGSDGFLSSGFLLDHVPRMDQPKKIFHPVLWVITNFVAMGIPFSIVIWVTATLFKDLGHSDGEITIATGSVGIVWSLKPLWAGFLDMFRTKKFFVVSMEFVIGALFVLMGLALNLDAYFTAIIAMLWFIAFASATQDICSDGIYISTLNKAQQATYIGVQGMAWNLGRIVAVSGVVWFAGHLQKSSGLPPKSAWMYALLASGALMAIFGLYHSIVLPTGSVPEARQRQSAKQVIDEFLTSASDFCNKRSLWGMLAFVFFYRSAEGLLLMEAPLFLQSCLERGGLQLSLVDKGVIDGTISTIATIVGGLLGGAFIARSTLKKTLLTLALCMNVPHACYLYLSYSVTPLNHLSYDTIALMVGLEKFWYGFGFVGNMLYMMQQIAPGKFKMTHYAFATAFMNLVLVPTQMASGPLADSMGFRHFFLFVFLAAVPSLAAAWFAPFPQPEAKEDDSSVDDAARLDEDDRKMQAAARHATILALLAAALFLYPDTLAIGWMSSTESGIGLAFFLALLAMSTILKIILSVRAIIAGRAAVALSKRLSGGRAYLSNATGAVIGGALMLAISLTLALAGGRKLVQTDWGCAFSPSGSSCLVAAVEPPRVCQHPTIDRESGIGAAARRFLGSVNP